jgi:hypothetical protein
MPKPIIEQLNKTISAGASPAENDDARLTLLDPFGDRCEYIGTR